jgi:hypothetical protein
MVGYLLRCFTIVNVSGDVTANVSGDVNLHCLKLNDKFILVYPVPKGYRQMQGYTNVFEHGISISLKSGEFARDK